jgi:hypothetical protein
MRRVNGSFMVVNNFLALVIVPTPLVIVFVRPVNVFFWDVIVLTGKVNGSFI